MACFWKGMYDASVTISASRETLPHPRRRHLAGGPLSWIYRPQRRRSAQTPLQCNPPHPGRKLMESSISTSQICRMDSRPKWTTGLRSPLTPRSRHLELTLTPASQDSTWDLWTSSGICHLQANRKAIHGQWCLDYVQYIKMSRQPIQTRRGDGNCNLRPPSAWPP